MPFSLPLRPETRPRLHSGGEARGKPRHTPTATLTACALLLSALACPVARFSRQPRPRPSSPPVLVRMFSWEGMSDWRHPRRKQSRCFPPHPAPTLHCHSPRARQAPCAYGRRWPRPMLYPCTPPGALAISVPPGSVNRPSLPRAFPRSAEYATFSSGARA